MTYVTQNVCIMYAGHCKDVFCLCPKLLVLQEDLDCPGHKVFVKTNRAKGRARYAERNAAKLDENSAADAKLDKNFTASDLGFSKILPDIDIEKIAKNCDTASDIDDINKCCPKDTEEPLLNVTES